MLVLMKGRYSANFVPFGKTQEMTDRLAAMNAFNRLGDVKDIGGQTIGINGAMA